MSDIKETFDDGFNKEMGEDFAASNSLTAEEKQIDAPIQEPAEKPIQEKQIQENPVQEAPNFDQNYRPDFNQYQNQYNYQNHQNYQNPTGAYPPPPPYHYAADFAQKVDQTPEQPPHFNKNESEDLTPPPKKTNKGKLAVAAIICFCLAIAVAAMFVGSGTIDYDTTETTILSDLVEIETTSSNIVVNTDSSEELTAVEVAALVRQSVVGVLCYDSSGQLGEEGSGVIISEADGYTYIITCAHVISGNPSSLGILLLDGSSYEAEIVGYDEETDIGVLRVETTGLPIIEIGDSSSLQVGETVYAIGNPGGTEFFGSITDGIVSSIDRSFSSSYSITLIQHNAAINPGNSGGALVNSAGQLVGINSSKIADTDYEGMGFAVPTSVAISIAEDLINYGYVPNRPKLGIEYASISSYQLYSMIATMQGLPSESLVIAGISSDSSLADTEAEVGDLIIAVNGIEMTDSSILLDLIEAGEVGDELVLTLCRIDNQYQTSTFDVTVYLVEDVPTVEEETTTSSSASDYYYGGSNSFSDFLEDYFGYNY